MRIGLELGTRPYILSSLLRFAVLAIKQGEIERGLSLPGLILSQEAADQDLRNQATTLIEPLKTSQPPELIEAALAAGAALDLMHTSEFYAAPPEIS